MKCLDLMNGPQFSASAFASICAKAAPPALVPTRERAPVATTGETAFRRRLVQGQRLLAKHVLPSLTAASICSPCSACGVARTTASNSGSASASASLAVGRPPSRRRSARAVSSFARRPEPRDVGRRRAQNAEHFSPHQAQADRERLRQAGSYRRVFGSGEKRTRGPWRSPKRARRLRDAGSCSLKQPDAARCADESGGKQSFISAKRSAGFENEMTCLLSRCPPLWRRPLRFAPNNCGHRRYASARASALL